MNNPHHISAAALLTWLNGRALEIRVMQGDQEHSLWSPEDAVSIEQAIVSFADQHNIDIRAEVELPH